MEKERLKETRCVKVIWDVLHSVLIFKIQKLLQKNILQLSFIESYHKINSKSVLTYLLNSQSRHVNQRTICWLLFLKIMTAFGDGELTPTWISLYVSILYVKIKTSHNFTADELSSQRIYMFVFRWETLILYLSQRHNSNSNSSAGINFFIHS